MYIIMTICDCDALRNASCLLYIYCDVMLPVDSLCSSFIFKRRCNIFVRWMKSKAFRDIFSVLCMFWVKCYTGFVLLYATINFSGAPWHVCFPTALSYTCSVAFIVLCRTVYRFCMLHSCRAIFQTSMTGQQLEFGMFRSGGVNVI